jgi:hypothetical protein
LTVVVASVDSVACIPVLSVESAVSTKRNTVLGQDVRGEKVARLVIAVGVGEVLLVELGLRLASGSAEARVVRVGVEETHAIVGVIVLAVLLDVGSVDGSGKIGGSIEVIDSGGALAFDALASL